MTWPQSQHLVFHVFKLKPNLWSQLMSAGDRNPNEIKLAVAGEDETSGAISQQKSVLIASLYTSAKQVDWAKELNYHS